MKKYLIILIVSVFTILNYCDILDVVSNKSEEYTLMRDLSQNKWFSVSQDFFEKNNTRLDFAKNIAFFLERFRIEPEVRKNTREKNLDIYRLTVFFKDELEFFGWSDDNIRLLLKISRQQSETSKNQKLEKIKSNNKQNTQKKNIKNNLKDLKMTFLSEVSKFSDPSDSFVGMILLLDYSKEFKIRDNIFNIGIQNDSISFDDDKRLDINEYTDFLYRFEYKISKDSNFLNIGRGRETEVGGLLLDDFITDRIHFSYNNINVKFLNLDYNISDYNGMRFSKKADIANTISFSYKIDKEKIFNIGKISGIDTDNNGNEDNSFMYIGGSIDKVLNQSQSLKAAFLLYDYEYLNPAIGLTDSKSIAMKLDYKKEKMEFSVNFQQSGFAYILGAKSFEKFTLMERPLFPQLGFNGNVIDINIVYRPDNKKYVKFETMSPETDIAGDSKINILGFGTILNIKKRLYKADVCYIDKEDTTGFFNGSINNMFGWKNISSSGTDLILRLTTEIKF